MKKFPGVVDQDLRPRLISAIKTSFGVVDAEIYAAVEGVELRSPNHRPSPKSTDSKFEEMLPVGENWFRRYVEYTRYNESPMSFHVFSSLCALAACVGSKVFMKFGKEKLIPNMCTVLVGPTGLVMKSSACNFAYSLVRDTAVCPIITDQFTPSRFVSVMAQTGAHQFIYCPELSNSINREKFNESLITVLLRMLDCPEDGYVNETQSRQKEVVVGQIALTILAGTAPELIVKSMPAVALTGGFINRFLWVHEDDTDRMFARPWTGLGEAELSRTMKRMVTFVGEVKWSEEVSRRYDEMYAERKKWIRQIEDSSVVRAIQRGDKHLLKIAMLVNMVLFDTLEMQEKSLEFASSLIRYAESRTPGLVKSLVQDEATSDVDFVVDVLERMGGLATHSDLLRRTSWKIGGASGLKQHMRTLIEQGRVKESKKGVATLYVLQKEEE